MLDRDDTGQTTLFGDPIVEEARKRWDRCAEFELMWRQKFLDDLKFANADSDNGYQWPNSIRRSRDVENRPCLTMNIIRQHNLQIVNQARQNKSSMKIIATGGGSSVDSANIFKALIRDIEYKSNAEAAYRTARKYQVDGGYGAWRLITAYPSDKTFDQQIRIVELPDPLSIYMDCDIQRSDGLDAKYAFAFDNVPKAEFRDAYPRWADQAGQQPLGIGSTDDDYVTKDYVRVCEYFRVVKKADKLVSFIDPNSGERKCLQQSFIRKAHLDEVLSAKGTKTRDIEPETVEWKLIVGQRVIDDTIWLGKYIPIVRIIGEETRLEGILDRKGHTRAMKDAQRMYNYNASAQVEFVALQGKTPWVAAVKAIEELEQYWNSANTTNHSVLPYNHVDDSNPDKPIPPPQRQEPPKDSPAYQNGMETAFNQMMMTSGQYQNQLGMQGNERTGAAIGKRQQQSDTSTFHFQDNFAEGLRTTARMIIDLGPKIWVAKQITKVLADDGSELEVEINPAAKQAFQAMSDHQGKVIRRIFNPTIGEYDVAADVGPSYGTRREESLEALTLILTQAPGLTGLVGDLLFKNMDIEEAQEAAQRLKRMVPPQALGQGTTPKEQQLEQQIQALSGALTKSLQRVAKTDLKLVGKDQMRDIDAHEAETKRMAALAKLLPMDHEGLQEIIHQLVKDSLSTQLVPIIQANRNGLGQQSASENPDEVAPPGEQPQNPTMPHGARQAPDGQWYLADPTRRGRYLRIAPLAQERSQGSVIANG